MDHWAGAFEVVIEINGKFHASVVCDTQAEVSAFFDARAIAEEEHHWKLTRRRADVLCFRWGVNRKRYRVVPLSW